MSVDTLLARLDAVRERGRGRWMAKCPAHNDRSPSLSITETSDGTVLLKCFAGCGIDAVTDALAVDVADLFPPREREPERRRRERRPFNAADILAAIRHELTIIVAATRHLLDGKELHSDDQARFLLAVDRIVAAIEVSDGR